MTPKERMAAFGKSEEIDRIPISLSLGESIVPFFGYDMNKYSNSAEIMAEVEIKSFKTFRPDSSSISITLRGMGEAMGSIIEFPQSAISYVKESAVKEVNDIDKLKVADPQKDGRLPLFLRALKLTKETIGDEVNVSGGIAGPFTVATCLVGAENLLKWTIKYPDKVKQLMDLIAESNNRYIKELANLGVGVSISDPVTSSSLLGKKQFNAFSYPSLKNNIQTAIKLTGRKPSIHVCGKSKSLWEPLVEAGVSSFSIDNVEDLSEAKEIIGDKITITGNVPPVEVINRGAKESIYSSVKKCIRKAYDSPKGYILAPGCQIPMFTSKENIQHFINAGKYYGHYPINEDLLNS